MPNSSQKALHINPCQFPSKHWHNLGWRHTCYFHLSMNAEPLGIFFPGLSVNSVYKNVVLRNITPGHLSNRPYCDLQALLFSQLSHSIKMEPFTRKFTQTGEFIWGWDCKVANYLSVIGCIWSLPQALEIKTTFSKRSAPKLMFWKE